MAKSLLALAALLALALPAWPATVGDPVFRTSSSDAATWRPIEGIAIEVATDGERGACLPEPRAAVSRAREGSRDAPVEHRHERRGVRQHGRHALKRVERRRIQLDEPLKALGEAVVPIRLHADVTAQLKVTIVRE